MGILTKSKNVSYWFNYCKKNNIEKIYLAIKSEIESSSDDYQIYRVKYYEQLAGYALEVFSEDRFLMVYLTSAWVEQEYDILIDGDKIEEKEKYVINNDGLWEDKRTINSHSLSDNGKPIKKDIIVKSDDGIVVYYDFSNKLQ